MNAYLKTKTVVALCSVAVGGILHASTVLVSDTYTVTGSGSGFALNTGVNTGINPPTTRLTGTMAPNLRYINTGTKATSAYTIGSNKLKVASVLNPGRFTLSANGTAAFDFGPALGVTGATPANPIVYDMAVNMDNDATATDRISFAIGTSEGDATTWAFGVQLYRVASGNTFYTIGKRIDTTSSGLAADLNSAIATTGSGTYGTELTFLVRVTDAGSESSTFHSRVQVSLNGGSTWIYDTATDSDLTSGFRFNGAGRIIMWDQAPSAVATYDNFSLTWNSGPHTWIGAGANGNWSTVANWGGPVPVAGDTLIFNGTTRQTSTNDLASLSVPWMTFNNGGFTLWGNTLTATAAITNLSGNNTLKQGLAFGTTGVKTWSVAAGTELVLDNTTTIETNGDHTIVGGGNVRTKGTMNIGQATTSNPAFTVNEGKHIVDGGTFNSRGGYRIGSLATGIGAQTILTNGATLNLTVLAGNLRVGDSANPVASQLNLNNSTLTMAGGIMCVPFAAGAIGSVNQVGGTASGFLLSFNDSGAGTGSYTVTGGGTLQPLQISEGISSGTSTITFDNATLRPATGASNPFMAGLNTAQINAGGLTIDTPADITISQVLSGSGALTKTGSAALTLSGNNTFSGGTVLSAGTLNVGNAGGAGTGTLTLNGGTISPSGAARTISNPVVVGGNFTVGGTDAMTFSGSVNLGGTTRSLNIANTATTTVSGVVSGSGGLTKDGAGTLQFSGTSANTYSGLTTVDSGTLLLAQPTGVNAIAGSLTIGDGVGGASADVVRLAASEQISSSAVTISASGLLDLNGFSETIGSLSGSAGGQVNLGVGTMTAGDSTSTTYAGSISGTGNLVKAGSGTLTLSGASTFSGSTTINSGVVNVQNGTTLGGAGAVTVNNGTALELQGGVSVSGQPATINGTGIGGIGALRNVSGNNTWGGSVTLGSASSIQSDSGTLTLIGAVSGGALTVAGVGNTTIGGVISGSGTLSKNGTGTLTLNGANTYSGSTTISAGTLALGSSGSIVSSPTITVASGATYNVSAVTGYTLGTAQILARNTTSGVGTVSGSMTLASGAKISLQADGSGSTIGSVNVAGNLTLNNNNITINISGAALGVGTYSLVTYTGTRTGAFSSTPTFTGSGIASGLTATLVQGSGTISLQVAASGHGIAAARLKVIENDLGNTSASVTVSTVVSINGMAVRYGSSRGDYSIQVGSTETDDFANGTVMTCVAENGRDNGEDSGINYCTSSISSSSGVSYFIPTSQAPTGAEYNINVAAAYFPYNRYLAGLAKNSAGISGGPNDSLTGSPGLVLGTHFIDHGDGTSTVDLTSMGINSQSDGILLVTAAANNNNFANCQANADGTWTINVKDNGSNGNATVQGPVAFAYVPLSNPSVISGKFHSSGSILMYNGSSPRFNVVSNSAGQWTLTIPGYSPSSGVLVISPETSGGANADNAISYQPSGSSWIIQSRDLPQLGLQTPNDTVCSFIFVPAPTATLVAPANGAVISSAPSLTVTANNPGTGNVKVTFYGHRAAIPGPGPDFLIPVLPDTQNYAREDSANGQATRQMWYAQTDWIISHRDSDNIPFVATLGDCVQNGDTKNGNPNEAEWQIGTNAYYRLEDQQGTKRLDGIPYLVTVGNHDQDPNGDPDGTTTLYNKYFGSSHFTGKSYYGGHYSTNNDTWYALFSAGGLDFLVLSFEYGRDGSGVFSWAQGVVDQYPTRRILVLTHYAGDDTPDDTTVAPFSGQGQLIYTALRTNANFFMMLGGHVFNEGGEGRRSDTFQGHTVRTMISDYQGRFNGGNGLMRLLYFSPSNNIINVKTFSPYTGLFETDANSTFSYTYNMQPNGAGSPATAYAAIGTNSNVTPGSQTSVVWNGLAATKTYEWYVTVADNNGDYSTSVVWNFQTSASFSLHIAPSADANGNGLPDAWEAKYNVTDPNADDDGDGQSNYAEYIAGTNPRDAGSVLRIVSTACNAKGQVTLTWSSVGGTRYRIQVADDANGTFTDIVRDAEVETDSAPVGAASTQTYTDTASSPNSIRFYRIEVVH